MTEEKRFLDEADSEEKEQEPQPEPSPPTPTRWAQWLHIAGSIAGVTALSILTLEMALGSIRLGKVAAYALGSSLLIGILFILVIGYRYALSKIKPGLWRYTFWFISVPLAFFYYLFFIFLIFGQFAPLLVRAMEAAFANAP